MQVLDGQQDDIRRDALDAICTAGVMLGPDFQMFVPVIRKVRSHLTPSVPMFVLPPRVCPPPVRASQRCRVRWFPEGCTRLPRPRRCSQACQRHRVSHEWFERLAGVCLGSQPPCMSEAEDWEATR